MTSLVEAIQKKYEKLTEGRIFETFVQRSPNRVGANILFPARTLSMDCQRISKVGSEEELFRAAGHVVELDLAGNKLCCWNEIFTLLRCLQNLESLNLSQNPLGLEASNCTTISEDSSPDPYGDSIDAEVEESEYTNPSDSVDMDGTVTCCLARGSPILRFASHEVATGHRSPTFETAMSCDQENKYMHSDLIGATACASKDLAQFNGSSEWNGPPLEKCTPPIRLALENGVLNMSTTFPRLTVLALNSTFVPWNWVLDLLHRFPNLATLHVALNNYGAEEDCLEGAGDNFDACLHLPVFPRLRTLYYSDNGISNWWTVCRLGRNFPSLEHLVLLGNPITHIPAPLSTGSTAPALSANHNGTRTGCKLVDKLSVEREWNNCATRPTSARTNSRVFANVHTLGLSETLIERWESIDYLGEWMPALTNLRLGNTLPVFQSWPESDCRAHVIARLPKLTTYNRSVIDSDERETAEREFVRYFGQVEPASRPARYWELERTHGRLEPLADIDLSPKRFVRVRVVLDGKETVHDLNLSLKVSQAKRQFLQLFDVNPAESKRYKLFYFDQVMTQIQGPEELKFPSRAMHSYQLETGDLFELLRIPDRHKPCRSG
ncbi:unnamed protein product [Dicrocoelium dendriticum]|nr:unnamed protein product [Dicrocoelium dendriticum]